MARTGANLFAAQLGRMFLGSYFVLEGSTKLANLDSAMGMIAAYGIPASGLLVILIALFELLMGAFIFFRYHTKIAATALAVYLLTATTIIHFPLIFDSHSIDRVTFMKDLAIVGGLLFMCAHCRGYSYWFTRATRAEPAKELFDVED